MLFQKLNPRRWLARAVRDGFAYQRVTDRSLSTRIISGEHSVSTKLEGLGGRGGKVFEEVLEKVFEEALLLNVLLK